MGVGTVPISILLLCKLNGIIHVRHLTSCLTPSKFSIRQLYKLTY